MTGGTGYLGGHTVAALPRHGHEVRTTVRSTARAGHLDPRVEVVEADLSHDRGWVEATAGCRFVLHVASPFPATQPDDPDEVIVPARDGALRVIRAAHASGVERVVMTSSFAAVGYPVRAGHRYTEEDWTDPTPDLEPYVRSKAVAERAAWDLVATLGGPVLTVLNPTGIFGPVLGPDVGTSAGIVRAMLDGHLPEAPRAAFGVVDVRDVAEMHVRAMTRPAAAGRRFVLTAGTVTMLDIADVLRERLGARAAAAPTREAAGGEVPRPEIDTARARDVLGFAPRAVADTIEDTALSLLDRAAP
ncbi:NAD-dependent epimerase/dehydratase family protein [Nocardioides secundeburneus]|uniref:NAD-dependent epimerase/dehydratase family protein n=1 Tax=Nocardioides sp. C4-1 TaxID=3151851 RepID=UPI003266776A